MPCLEYILNFLVCPNTYDYIYLLMGCQQSIDQVVHPQNTRNISPSKQRKQSKERDKKLESSPQIRNPTNSSPSNLKNLSTTKGQKKLKIKKQKKSNVAEILETNIAPDQSLEIKSPQKLEQISININKNFEIAILMNKKMKKLAHTSDSLRQVAQTLISSIGQIEEKQFNREINLVSQMFRHVKQIHSSGKLFYHSFVEEFKKELGEKKIKVASLSRIYHMIANYKFEQRVNEEKYNQFDVFCWKTNGYDHILRRDIDDIVQFEAVASKIEKLGIRMKTKFESIEKQSQNILNLLAECLCLYEKDLKSLKYNLSQKEAMRVAEISRDACNYHDSGVVLLFLYLVRACNNLEKQGEGGVQIQRRMRDIISKISKKYPPGEGLKQEQQHLKHALERLAYEDKFIHKPYKFTSKDDQKQGELQNLILFHAKKAKDNRADFEELVRQTCSSMAIQIKTGLKLNPDKPNKKAIIRIKEKMLFGKTQVIEKVPKSTIAETLTSQDEDYKRKIDQLLSEKEQVTFKISDMVRGKCVFLEINDIILAVEQIKAFVKRDKNNRYQITEIESRFTNKIPISDVTLKIAINKQLVSELQLTVQSNAAAYNFAHKVYELERTKVFSRMKITFNYYQQFQGDFKQLILTAINLAGNLSQKTKKDKNNKHSQKDEVPQENEKITFWQKYTLIKQNAESIRKFIDLTQTNVPTFEEILGRVIDKQEKSFVNPQVSTDIKLQGLMVTIFNMEMGSWQKQLGHQINSVLEMRRCSQLLKSTLLYYFFKKFDISKELTKMFQFFPTYQQLATREDYKPEAIESGQNFMEFYLQQIFSINKPFEFANKTARSFYKATQIKQVCIQKQISKNISKLRHQKYILGVVVEDISPETVAYLIECLSSYFMAKEESAQMIDVFNQYYNWLMNILEKKPILDPSRLIRCSAELLYSQILLNKGEFKKAHSILMEIIKTFRLQEQVQKWLECELLLAECQAHFQKNLQNFKHYYSKHVVEKAKALGMEMRGKIVADSEWRIYLKLWKKDLNPEDAKYVEQMHLFKALRQSSRSESIELIRKIRFAQNNGHKDILSKIQIIKNRAVKSITLSGEKDGGNYCQIMSKVSWTNLQTLALNYDNIKAKDCLHLGAAGWSKLTALDLGNNIIGPVGCLHLGQGGLVSLLHLNLENNEIGFEGCKNLSRGSWTRLMTLNLAKNNINAEGCLHLSKPTWEGFTSLDLDSNNIGSAGCAHLSKALWPRLTSLKIGNNSIDAKGCASLASAEWQNLTNFDIHNNILGEEGYKSLSKAKWPKLTNLNLRKTGLNDLGCLLISQANWTKLTHLDLQSNSVGDEGSKHLCSGDWRELKILNLFYDNKLSNEGKETMRKKMKSNYIRFKW